MALRFSGLLKITQPIAPSFRAMIFPDFTAVSIFISSADRIVTFADGALTHTCIQGIRETKNPGRVRKTGKVPSFRLIPPGNAGRGQHVLLFTAPGSQ